MVLVGVYFGGDSLIPDGIWGLHADAAAVGPVHRKPRPGDIPPTWISPALHPKSSVTVRGGAVTFPHLPSTRVYPAAELGAPTLP